MTDGFAILRFHSAADVQCAYRKLSYFIIKGDNTLDNYPVPGLPCRHSQHSSRRTRPVPGRCIVDWPFPDEDITGFTMQGKPMPASVAARSSSRVLAKTYGEVGKPSTSAASRRIPSRFMVSCAARADGMTRAIPKRSILYQHACVKGLDLWHDKMWPLMLHQCPQRSAVCHINDMGAVRDLMPGRVWVTVHRNGFDTQSLQCDDDLFAEFAAAEQHDPCRRTTERCSDIKRVDHKKYPVPATAFKRWRLLWH